MSSLFFRRKKKGAANKKRKWQQEQEDIENQSEEEIELRCKICSGDPILYCLDCKKYYCQRDFEAQHDAPKAVEPENDLDEAEEEEPEETNEQDEIAGVGLAMHRVRPLPNENLDNLTTGNPYTLP